MNDVIQQFEQPVVGRDGERYVVYVRGRQRDDGRWQAAVEFRRVRDGARFGTATETTQPDWSAVLYWASGLGAAYFDGALERALHPHVRPDERRPFPPTIDRGVDSAERDERRAIIARSILEYFRRQRAPRILTQDLFDRLPFASGDIVRALEWLEKSERVLARRTEQGNDWIFLTEDGLRAAELDGVPHGHDRAVMDPRKPRK